jgi:hypothetical protein
MTWGAGRRPTAGARTADEVVAALDGQVGAEEGTVG